MAELEALRDELQAFRRAGAQVFAACPQRAEFSLALEREHSLGFPILRDTDNRAATAFGLTLPTPLDVQAAEEALGLDLPAHNGTTHWDLPMPARYVIGVDGSILWARVHPDHRERSEPIEALAVL